MLAVAPLRGSGSEHVTRAMRSLEAIFLIGVKGVTEIWLVRHADCYRDMMRLEPGQLRLLPYYTSVSVVRVLGDRRMVGGLCDVAHLE